MAHPTLPWTKPVCVVGDVDRPPRLVSFLSTVVPIAAAIFGALWLGSGSLSLLHAGVIMVLSVATEMAPVPTRSGIRLTPCVVVVAALPIGSPTDDRLSVWVAGLMAPIALGVAIVWVIRTTRHDDQHKVLVDIARRLTGSIAYLTAFGAATTLVPSLAAGYGELVAVLIGFVTAVIVEFLVGQIFRFGSVLESSSHLLRREMADFVVYFTLVLVGAWGGMVWLDFGFWVLAIGPLLYLFADRAFRRLNDVRITYGETIRALAKIPEVANQVVAGHADRTALLAEAVAGRYRIGPTEVDLITRAALLHDIGRISMNDPGVAGLGATEAEVAGWGAEIVREASLTKEADLIARQCEVFRHPGQPYETDLPLGSRIIKVCSAFDQGVHEMGLSNLEAMERLHRGSVYDFDPEIVDRLRSILEARRAFTPSVTGAG